MKTLLLFLAGLAVAVLAMALGSGRVEPGSLLAAAATAALLASASADGLPRARRSPAIRRAAPATCADRSWRGGAAPAHCPCPSA